METYWPKRLTFGDDDHDNSSEEDDLEGEEEEEIVVVQPPVADDEDDEEEHPDPEVAYARYRARIAKKQAAGFTGWQAELRAWNKDIRVSATNDTDLCKYWEVG